MISRIPKPGNIKSQLGSYLIYLITFLHNFWQNSLTVIKMDCSYKFKFQVKIENLGVFLVKKNWKLHS